jgi:hypothetical protein
MTAEPRYKTPEAARRAVTDKLRAEAAHAPWPLPDLQRQYAYDQLVERLYRLDDRWVIKDATALLARRVSVRHTIDIDVYRAGAIAAVERQVRDAAALDIVDWMTFEVGPSTRIEASGALGSRVRMKALIGTKVWATFQVDIVADGIQMSTEPDTVQPLTSVVITDQNRAEWQAYPLVDHVADKVCAILERHNGNPSSRYKDLIDLVAIIRRSRIDAQLQRRALAKEATRRRLSLPDTFDVPDRSLWERGYRAEARRTVGLDEIELGDALAVVGPFLEPLLTGIATGEWDPDTQTWLHDSPHETG